MFITNKEKKNKDGFFGLEIKQWQMTGVIVDLKSLLTKYIILHLVQVDLMLHTNTLIYPIFIWMIIIEYHFPSVMDHLDKVILKKLRI